ncbi:hypothetical protein CR513_42327, partial [Mucuna pruriens]
MALFDACHIDMWDVVEKVRNFLMYALTKSEYEKFQCCKSSKEMWDALALAYEDTSEVEIISDHLASVQIPKEASNRRTPRSLLKHQRPKPKPSRQRNLVENHQMKIVLMKTNSHSSEGRSNPCGSTRED